MSRAFVKEDADTEPVLVLARASLPEGVPNLMTPVGWEALEAERAELEAELGRALAAADTRAVASARGRLEELALRLESARVVRLPDVIEKIQAGATVTLRRADGQTLCFRIVGVDEADPAAGSVAFTAPVAAAAMEKRVGDVFTAPIGGKDVRFEVVGVEH
ncbi:MAG: GreA/GreB family elongation factor [Trueperaceae bacterium]|nr:GreA/GreB family elongation factor [Trueperaceae bacterium]